MTATRLRQIRSTMETVVDVAAAEHLGRFAEFQRQVESDRVLNFLSLFSVLSARILRSTA
jgi:hypothetical protein